MDMDYELAKELKDAGFPLKRIQRGETHGHYWRDVFTTPDDKSYLIPTLEELIEACRPYFWDLVCNVGIRRGDVVIQEAEWVADARIDNITATGDTPAEAVARLWLALNKKS